GAGARGRDREGSAEDEVALRRPTRALLARRGDAPRGVGRAPYRHRHLTRRAPPGDPGGRAPLVGRAGRRRGDAPALRRGGAQRAGLRGAHPVPRGRGRDPGRLPGPGGARPAGARVPAQAALALGLRSAARELCRVRRRGGPRRLSRAGRRSRLHCVGARRDGVPVAGRVPRHAWAHLEQPGRGPWPRTGRARVTRRARGRHRRVRVPRRVPPPHAHCMRRELADGYELDDDSARIDRAAVHAYLTRSYWAEGRHRATQDALIESAARVVGLYRDGEQVGFSRAISDGHVQSYLADVYVLEEHRGRGLGVELVRFSVDEGPLAGTKWYLHTRDAHDLYRKFGFGEPDERALERRR